MSDFTLYQLDAALRNCIEGAYTVDEETGELLFRPEDIEELQIMRRDKLEGCALFIKNLESAARALKAEEDALKVRRQHMERKAERMRQYVLDSMLGDPTVEVDTPRAKVTVRKPSQVVIVTDEDKLPAAMVRVKTEPDKTAIKEAIKRGEEVPGAHIGLGKPSLVIK